jgi:hypothetical protein
MGRSRIPLGAIALAFLGGFLILLEGAVYLVLGISVDALSTAGNGTPSPGVGLLAILFGSVILVLSGVVIAIPGAHRGLGLAILTLSLVSLPLGGGFLLGTLVGWVGGVAILFAHFGSAPLGELDADWSDDIDDPVVEAELHDAGVRLPPPREPVEPST